MAFFTLHNFCEVYKTNLDAEIVRTQVKRNREHENNYRDSPDPTFWCNTTKGEFTRNTLTVCISQNLLDNF